MKIRYFAGGSALALALTLGGGAVAQTADTNPATEVEEVVVTGSLIRGTPEDAALPVDVIGQEELEKQGSPSTVELLKALPVSNGVLGDTNQFDARAQGSEGSGSVNLRGLGPQRTLVLLNGRRITANPLGQVGTGIVDTNIIPSAAIGRIEVLKDGAAATYGSDAIGGVVNFITRKNFDGLEVGGSFRFIDGSDGDYTGQVVWGWGNDNADVLLTAGYQHRSRLSITERDWATRDYLDNPEGGWSSGNAVTTFLPTYSPAAGVYAPAAGLQSDVGCEPLGGFQGVTSTGTAACYWNYTPYDNLVEIEDRFQLYGQVDFDLNDNHRFHGEALYAETDVPEWNTSPSYLALQVPTATTNPAYGTLSSGYFVPSTNPGFISYKAQNPTQIPAFANGVYYPGVLYRPYSLGGNPMFDYGPSEGTRHYEAYRVSGGFNGEWDNGLGYDVAMTYSQETGVRTGYDTVVSRFQLALRGYGSLASDVADGGGCTATETSNYTTGAGNAALGCYYFNPFSNSIERNSITGAENPDFDPSLVNSADLTRWFFVENATKQTQRLFVLDAVLSGGTGINLPGGEIKWAAGMQYRRDFFLSQYNDMTNLDVTPCIDTPITGTTSCTVRNGPMMFLGGGYESDLEADVYALLTEFSLPITDTIQAQLAARFEDYGGAVGSTFDPKLSVRWQVTDWMALRTSIGTTFRGPPQTQLAPGSVTSLQYLGGAFRAVDIFGNENLEPESAKTFSFGAIFKLLDNRLKTTIDYWSFDFDNPIVSEPGGQIFSAMFPTGTGTGNCADPAYDDLETRFVFQGACSVSNIARIETRAVNGPRVQTSGIDVLADYNVGDFMGGEVRVGTSFTYVKEYTTDDFIVEGVVIQPSFDAAGHLNYQTSAYPVPQWKGSAYAEFETGPHNIRWTVNYIGEYDDQRTSIRANNPNVPGTCTPFVVGCGAPILSGLTIDKMITHDLDYRYQAPWDTTVVLSIDNLFDEEPPFARLDLNYDPFTHNGLGRTMKVAVTKRF
ncbi:MAG TPA: TonB-dependent receptor [Caulobacteraceae bacterium]